jgi:deoxyribose-phosphate aldolase
MEIDKLIEKIAEEVYQKVASQINNVPAGFNTRSNSSMNSNNNIGVMIDHTILKAEATLEQVEKLCKEAIEYRFASVCVNSCFAAKVSEMLRGSGVKTCCVVGFPLGAMSIKAKAEETKEVIENGATEVDMVINVGALKSGDWDYVKRDIEAVVNAAKGKALVKVIIEACLLTEEEKVKVCTISKMAGADFVKTSTGFSTGGATVEDIKLMRLVVGPDMGVKASGGIKDYKTAMAMINAGASRIGTSSGISIVKNQKSEPVLSVEASNCINCGRCSQVCPTGNAKIIKGGY